MSTAEIQAFVHVVRAGGFTAAGRRMRIPKSTLSKQVARLEGRLGVRLLQRTTRRVAMTAEGEAFFTRCAAAIDALGDAEREAMASRDLPRGTLVVACPFDFARDWLSPSLADFRRRYPELNLEIRVSPRRVDLVGEGVDVAIRAGVLDDSALMSRRLANSELWFCASPAYLADRGRPRSLADLASHDVLTFTGPPGGWPITGPAGVERFANPGWLRINEWGSLCRLVCDGLGIGLIEAHAVQVPIGSGALERVLTGHAVTGGGLFAVYPSAKQLSPKVRVFIDFLVEHVTRTGSGPRPDGR
jgi:DNA-binding transcriptional LysR family regulator